MNDTKIENLNNQTASLDTGHARPDITPQQNPNRICLKGQSSI